MYTSQQHALELDPELLCYYDFAMNTDITTDTNTAASDAGTTSYCRS